MTGVIRLVRQQQRYGVRKRLRLHLTGFFRTPFRGIHFVDLSMESAAADAELFGCGGHVAIRGCRRLGNQFSFRLV